MTYTFIESSCKLTYNIYCLMNTSILIAQKSFQNDQQCSSLETFYLLFFTIPVQTSLLGSYLNNIIAYSCLKSLQIQISEISQVNLSFILFNNVLLLNLQMQLVLLLQMQYKSAWQIYKVTHSCHRFLKLNAVQL